MKRAKILSAAIISVAVILVLYYAYGVIKNRYFSAEKSGGEMTAGQEQNAASGEEAASAQNGGQEQTSSEENGSPEGAQPDMNSEGSHLYVTSGDCDNSCVKFKDNSEDFKYCQEVCGDIPVSEKKSKDECTSLSGLEKDYCFRDLAVSKKDGQICEEIKDLRVKKVCKNRVVEEILN
jgi:hypothetical protein